VNHVASPAPGHVAPDEHGFAAAVATLRRVSAALDSVLIGQHRVHHMVLVGVLSRGHVLLEGMPGLGKTTLIRALGTLLGLDFKRVQFTPDLMPGDIVGSSILQQTSGGHREMIFQPGPIFTNILLADEINRASPKTQSALLEAMQESRATVQGRTHVLPDPFFVLASQNPVELEGTYPLPEAQLDRFLLKVLVEMPGADVLEEIITTRRHGAAPDLAPVAGPQDVAALFAAMHAVVLPRPVARYIGRLVIATHPTGADAPDLVKRFVRHGASPRAAIALGEASRAAAMLAGRSTVGFEDVRSVAAPVLRHRMILGYEAGLERVSADDVVQQLLARVDEVPGALPKGVSLPAEAPHHA
jgi:MoxR-like ATPase